MIQGIILIQLYSAKTIKLSQGALQSAIQSNISFFFNVHSSELTGNKYTCKKKNANVCLQHCRGQCIQNIQHSTYEISNTITMTQSNSVFWHTTCIHYHKKQDRIYNKIQGKVKSVETRLEMWLYFVNICVALDDVIFNALVELIQAA